MSTNLAPGGRTQSACCTVQIAPNPPASCSADLCNVFTGYCPSDTDDESADSWTKRELESRDSGKTYYVDLNGVGIRIIAMAYPTLARMYGLPAAGQVIRSFFRLIQGYCVGPSIDMGTFPGTGVPSSSQLQNLQAEHPIDVSILFRRE
jgi:chitinase